jgi:hypothetical protein
MHGKTTELDFFLFFLCRRDYLSVCVCVFCVSVRVIFSFEKQHTPTIYKYEFFKWLNKLFLFICRE